MYVTHRVVLDTDTACALVGGTPVPHVRSTRVPPANSVKFQAAENVDATSTESGCPRREPTAERRKFVLGQWLPPALPRGIRLFLRRMPRGGAVGHDLPQLWRGSSPCTSTGIPVLGYGERNPPPHCVQTLPREADQSFFVAGHGVTHTPFIAPPNPQARGRSR